MEQEQTVPSVQTNEQEQPNQMPASQTVQGEQSESENAEVNSKTTDDELGDIALYDESKNDGEPAVPKEEAEKMITAEKENAEVKPFQSLEAAFKYLGKPVRVGNETTKLYAICEGGILETPKGFYRKLHEVYPV